MLLAAAATAPGAAEDTRYHGTDPNRDPKAHTPFRIVAETPQDPRHRGILVSPQTIELVEGGQLVHSVPVPHPGPLTFPEIARAVADPRWIVEVSPGVFGVAAAIVQGPGTTVHFAAPATTELRLATDPPGVFLGGRGPGTTGRFEGVHVTSWDLARRAPSEDLTVPRPFVLYERGARLEIVRSEMAYLGADYVGAYGVAWREEGATGEATESEFHHCFFGAYTYEAKDIVFRDNVFRDNVYYGLDPHDYSTGLQAVGNEAYRNGSHGIIFSRFVTASTITGNNSYGNKGNGIVLDFESNGNVVSKNRVTGNDGDGIVLLQSSDNIVEGNVVSGNGIGIRANKTGAANVIRDNRIVGNDVGIEAYDGARELILAGNHVSKSRSAGMILAAPGTTVDGGRVEGGRNGVEVRQPAAVRNLELARVRDGIVVRPGGSATLEGLTVDATRIGVRIDPGAKATLERSTVDAPEAVRGELPPGPGNYLAPPPVPPRPFPWLAVAGVAAVASAVVFEALAVTRERRHRRLRQARSPAEAS
jgi:parallel beta-helix repeat protein